jgi:hypothetical protein
LPFNFFAREEGRVVERTAVGVREHGLVVIVERWAGLRWEVVSWEDCFESREEAEGG